MAAKTPTLVCGPCCTFEAMWARLDIEFGKSDWPMEFDDHRLTWEETVRTLDFMDVLDALAGDACAAAVGATATERADDAVARLRRLAQHAGIAMSDDICAQARAQFVEDFTAKRRP